MNSSRIRRCASASSAQLKGGGPKPHIELVQAPLRRLRLLKQKRQPPRAISAGIHFHDRMNRVDNLCREVSYLLIVALSRRRAEPPKRIFYRSLWRRSGASLQPPRSGHHLSRGNDHDPLRSQDPPATVRPMMDVAASLQ